MRIVVVSHGDFAKGIVNSVQMLTGKQENLDAFGLYPDEDRECLKEQVRQVLEQEQGKEEVLVLSDLFHGTPFNVCVELSRDYQFEHLTGINLPLFIEIIMDRMMGKNSKEVIAHALQDVSDTVKDVNTLLAASDDDKEDD